MKSRRVLITGGSAGIGLAIGNRLLEDGAEVVSLSRSAQQANRDGQAQIRQIACDISDYASVAKAVGILREEHWVPDTLINNAGIALGAPHAFWEQSIEDIHRVLGVNVLGLTNVTYAVMRLLMMPERKGTILNISSVTGLEVPIKGMGEVSYHASKAFMEGFTNTLRNETIGTDIRVLTLRPGFVRTNFHLERMGNDQEKFDSVFEGMEPLNADDVAEAVLWTLSRPERISIKALDIVPTPQRSLTQNDRQWTARHRA